MIKNVEEALTAISDYYFYELGCSSKNYIYPKEAEEYLAKYQDIWNDYAEWQWNQR